MKGRGLVKSSKVSTKQKLVLGYLQLVIEGPLDNNQTSARNCRFSKLGWGRPGSGQDMAEPQPCGWVLKDITL